MSLDPAATAAADAKLWATYPELKGRRLTGSAKDAKYRKEWWKFYNEAKKNKPAAPSPPPSPAPAPPPISPVQPCPTPKKKIVKKCSDVAAEVQEGDVVLRSTPGDDSDLIRGVGNCGYSHAGIVARDSNGNLVIVDAYPGRTGGDVKTESVDSFFCGHGTMKGVVARPKDCDAGKKAAEWAMKQTTDPAYQFDLLNPWDQDPKNLYCSDLVYQAYGAAGEDLTPTKTDFLDPAHEKQTLQSLRDYLIATEPVYSKKYLAARFAPDSTFKKLAQDAFGGSEFVTPCNVAFNSKMDTAVEFQP